jgi:AcrR family transcriptional regulator
MSSLRMTSDLRRQLILGAAKRCFARNGFAGTTTKSVAAAAAISEALLFKHFPSKPSTATLVELIKGMVRHFLSISDGADHEEAQRLRLMTTSHLDDGEFARLLYAKVGDLIGPTFVASLDRAVAAGDASRIGGEPLNLFWFAHHTVLMAALSRLPAVPCLPYGNTTDLERQLCEFLLRGIGLHEAAITSHLNRALMPEPAQRTAAESA